MRPVEWMRPSVNVLESCCTVLAILNHAQHPVPVEWKCCLLAESQQRVNEQRKLSLEVTKLLVSSYSYRTSTCHMDSCSLMSL